MKGTSVESTPPSNVIVLGAGTMGTGIALTFAKAGVHVTLTARRRSTLEQARQRLEGTLGMLSRYELLEGSAPAAIQERITTTPWENVNDLNMDLVVESIAEDPCAKDEVLRHIEAKAPADTVIATNTSSLSLSQLAANLDRPGNFAGYHWFNPPDLIELVEVIPAPQTEADTLRKLVNWAIAVGRVPVQISQEIEGFVANRLQYALMREAYSLVEKGICTIEDIDRVVKTGLGPRWAGIGPYEGMDLAGLDVHHEVARRLLPTLANHAQPAALLQRLVVEGALGTKSGHGLYGEYDKRAIERLVERRTAVLAAIARTKARLEP